MKSSTASLSLLGEVVVLLCYLNQIGSLNILGILSFHRMECCNECVQCVAAVSSQDRAAQTHAEGADTGPVLMVTNVCFDDEKGTTYPRNH